jgi:hypothetical protein
MMSIGARRRIQRFCAWGGFWYVGVLLLGWAGFAGFLPPHLPSAGADEIAAIYQGSVTHIRVGMVFLMIGAMLCIPFTSILAQYVARIEGKPGILTYAVVMGGVCNVVLTFYPAIFWLVAAYRPDRSPEIIYMLNDWAWIQLIGGATIFWPLQLGMAIAALCDRSADPVFPRWSGWAALWMFFLLLPDQLLFFFKTGPFAWNGLFGIWIPLGSFGGWFLLASVLMVRAMKRGVYPDADPEPVAN